MNRRLDGMMERMHEDRLAEARLSLKAGERRRREKGGGGGGVDMGDAGREYDVLAEREEAETSRREEALKSERWSLDRAVLLHGTTEELGRRPPPYPGWDPNLTRDHDSERDELLGRIDAPQRRAAADCYRAVRMVRRAGRRLGAP